VNRTIRSVGFAVWAAFAVPLVFATYVTVSYRAALRNGSLPFLPPNEWRWDTAYFVLLASGIVAVAFLPISRRWLRFVLVALYATLMGFALLFVSFSMSCASGDCL